MEKLQKHEFKEYTELRASIDYPRNLNIWPYIDQ